MDGIIKNRYKKNLNRGIKVNIKGLNKSFGKTVAVKDININVNSSEFVTLLGPSGSGKTTILKLLAGFELPDTGLISIGGNNVTYLPPKKRNIGMVFQSYALFPHMTVFDNIAFPLRVRKVLSSNIKQKVSDLLHLVKLNGYEQRYPRELSGGQQQRVALARSLIFEPRILLLDEPLSALDKKLREEMQIELKRIQQELMITTINVTHDQNEALIISDRIAVLNNGEIQQIGTPSEIYEEPSSKFVAEFIGESNFLSLEIIERNKGSITGQFGNGLTVELNVPQNLTNKNGKLEVMIRPEKIRLVGDKVNTDNCFETTVNNIHYSGSSNRLELQFKNGQDIIVNWTNIFNTPIKIGQRIRIGWNSKDMIVI